MKNAIKTGLFAIMIAVAASSCTGSGSGGHVDSAKMDTATLKDTTHGQAGSNGSPAAIDSGMDKSGSGGTDTVKKP